MKAVLLGAMAVLCQATLKVMNPPALAEEVGNEGLINSSLANFGHITYGQTLLGKVIRPSADNAHGCKPFTWSDFPDYFTPELLMMHRGPLNTFVLLSRGHCSNPTKARNVEAFGSTVALIGDEKEEDVSQVIMEDYDGSGFSLKIPAYMIDHNAYVKIQNSIEEGKEVYL